MSGRRGILFDLDGVFYVGDEPVAGSAAVLDWARSGNIPYLFVTNTTSRSRAALVDKLDRFGLSARVEELLTPVTAAVAWLQRQRRQRVALLAPQAVRAEFDAFTLVDADCDDAAVVVGDLGEQWTFPRLNQAFRLLLGESSILIALGMTRFWRGPDGLRLDTGPFVRALEYASGKEAVVTGKPSATFFHAAAARLGLAPEELVMIGDDIRGDIEAAQQAGLEAIQVRTGKFRPQDLELGIKPEAVLDCVTGLPGWWMRNS